jgi:hypothetical protein
MLTRGIAFCGVLAALAAPGAALAKDSDHDGLPNGWEKGKTPQGLNLKKLGASPKHRDVFVEFNYSKKVGPADIQCGPGLNDLVAAYKSAPLSNPDGKNGIKLHIDAGKTCGSHDYDMGGSSKFKVHHPPCATPNDWPNVLSENRISVFHIGAIVDETELCGPEGQAIGPDFMVKTRGGGNAFAYVVMHELGHIFGLHHGITSDADSDIPFDKFSVMSGGMYEFGDNSGTSELDYQRFAIPAIDESDLDEHVGIETGNPTANNYLAQFYGPQFCLEDDDMNPMTPPVQQKEFQGHAHGLLDWDCDGANFWIPPYSDYIDVNHVSYDVNGDGVIGADPAVPPEWPTVGHNLGGGRIGG